MHESRSSSADENDPDRTVVDPAVMAERRARRAELAEESMADRVRGAEVLADTLRHRTDELERELIAATRERDELLGRLSSRERTLVSVQQAEESERRRRHEVEVESDADRRELEQEISDLRVRVGAAEAWAAELSAELTRTRNALDASRRELEEGRAAREDVRRRAEELDVRSRALDARREEMTAELSALRVQAGGLAERLTEEERQRSDAQTVLVGERERAEAQITLLEHELDRRAAIHEAVLAQLRGLGGEVARVRDGVTQDAERRALTERALTDVAGTARQLRVELQELERDRDAVAAELQAARAALSGRDDALDRARAEVGAVRADFEVALAEAAHRSDALAASQDALAQAQDALAGTRHALGAAQTQLVEAQDALAGSRHALAERDEALRIRDAALAERDHALAESRAAADGLLHQIQSRRDEQEALVARLAEAVAARDAAVVAGEAALAARQQEFTAQIQGFEATVGDLRGRLTTAAQEFDRSLGEAHADRDGARHELASRTSAFASERERLEQAQRELAASHARLAADLVQAHHAIQLQRERADAAEAATEELRDDRDRLAAELVRRDALDLRVRETVGGLGAELAELRLRSDARDAREAAVERLVTDLVDTARELREGFDRELREVRSEMELRGQADLLEADERLSAMRRHLESSVDRLREELEAEQAARRAAEASLDTERERVELAGLAAVDAAVDRDELARELGVRQAAEEEARVALAAAEQELTLLRRAPTPAQGDALAVVESLTRAARRLREERELVPEGPDEAGAAALALDAPAEDEAAPPVRPEPVADVDEAPDEPEEEVAGEDEDEPAVARAAVATPPSQPPPEAKPVRVPPARTAAQLAAAARAQELRAEAVPVRPRVVAPEDRAPSSWMTPALRRFAAEDPDVAAAALVTMLPALGLVAPKALHLDVTVRGRGTWRVALAPGLADVSGLTRASGDPDVTLVGDIDALAPLVAGGVQRRLPGVELLGRRRRLRRLLKERRRPIGLADLHEAGIMPSAGVLLGLLCRGVEADWVLDADVVDFAVSGPYGGTWRVRATPGRVPTVTVPDADDPEPDATVHVSDESVLALLAAVPLPPGERLLIGGDVDAANAVTGLFGRAQGLVAAAT